MTSPVRSEVEVRPDVVFLSELLRELTQGRLRVPRFQRPFVWRNEQMTDLLDSVRQQYPIGSLLVWETDLPIAALPGLGPFVFPERDQQAVGYVLDGHQRLTTLAGALFPESSELRHVSAEEADKFAISWDMEAGRFQHSAATAERPGLFPTTALLDTLRFFEAVDNVRLQWSHDPVQAERFTATISRLAASFQHYRIPVVRIKRTGLSEAVEIFARLNSRGQAMSADQMVSALLYREEPGIEFNLSVEIDNLSEEMSGVGFGDVDRTTLLRCFLANLDEDIYKTDWTRLATERREELLNRMRAAVERTTSSLHRATSFLTEEGVSTARLLPYSIQLVLLSAFFDRVESPTPGQVSLLRRFFWSSSFSGWFSGANPTRVNLLVREFRETVAVEDTPTTLEHYDLTVRPLPFPSNFDMRSARTRCAVVVMLKLEPRAADGRPLEEPWRLIADKGPNAMGRIFSNIPRSRLSNAANRMLRPPGEERSALAPFLTELARANRVDVLRSYAVDEVASRALLAADPEAFIAARQAYVMARENEFLRSLGIGQVAGEAREAPIDTE